MSAAGEVLTVGHSNLSYEDFLSLLRGASVTAVADVRTAPYSRYYPHFNREDLQEELKADGIAYAYLGNELGGRPKDSSFFCDGVADYEKMARTPEFAQGLERVISGSRRYRIAMMCSEHDPLECHRCLLVGRVLHEKGSTVRHILSTGEFLDHSDVESRLMEISGKNKADLFERPEARLTAAYREQASKVAFAAPIQKQVVAR
jgi:uncharacterized protein (DUF488 family)